MTTGGPATGSAARSANETAWRAAAEKAIGGDLTTLRSIVADGIAIGPLHPRFARNEARPWRAREGWAVSQRIDHPDPGEANALALLDLEGGADGLTLVLAGSLFARGYGLDSTHEALDAALAGVELDLIGLRLDAGGDTLAVARHLAAIVADRRLGSAALALDLCFDPIGTAARTGHPRDAAELDEIVALGRKAGLAGRALLADGRPWHEAGAGKAQELACMLATAVAYLRRLEAIGLSLDEARDQIAMLLPVDADVFLGLAQARALRRLWQRIEAAAGLLPKPLRLHAETSWRMMTRIDPWTNVMRATAASVAAGLGGVDAMTVLPMTLPYGLPDASARRLARNLGHILLDEANLAKVADPAAGSGGIEDLTAQLCRTAWSLFQDIERDGGIEAALAAGTVRRALAEQQAERAEAIAHLRQGIVGTSRYPWLAAVMPPTLDAPQRPPAEPSAGALPAHRDAEPFEALRDEADRLAAHNRRPLIFLATLGTPAASGPRAIIATNFFAAAGIATTAAPTEPISVAAQAARCAATATAIACLCGTEASYAEHGEAALRTLRECGARFILMATADESWLGRGADALVGENGDALRLLRLILDQFAGAGG